MKKLEILIGDDAFLEVFTIMTFNDAYIPRLKEGLKEYEISVKIETNPEKVIQEASKYDVVVTDLDYTGDARGRQGYEVVDAVAKLSPKPLLILCTSSDNYAEIKEKTEGKIDYHAGPNGLHKFDDLVDILINHYK